MSGGLALFWHESVYVDIQDANARHIDAFIRISPDDPLFHVTFVYGEPRVEHRHRMWTDLALLKASSELPWVVVGDFNEALWQYEHFSITPRAEPQMAAFRDCLQVCELKDLGFQGHPHTFDNKRSGSHNVRVRLDRAVADDRWRDIYSESSVTHLVTPCSDHSPILLQLAKEIRALPGLRHCLQYEIYWERDPTLKEIIDREWKGIGSMPDLGAVHSGLAKLMKDLHGWGKQKFGNITREVEKLREKLQLLQSANASAADIRFVSDQMNELLYKEEMLWL
jgi:hypothetical protein